MKEITIEVRPNSLSIQAGNIKGNIESAKKILKEALNALNQTPDQEFKNEIVYERIL